MRDGFIFYSSFYEAILQLDDNDRLAAYDMISQYALTGELPEGASGAGYAIFLMAKPQIDANEARRENGNKGGRPKNQNKTEAKPNDNLTETEAKPNGNLTITKQEPKEKDKEKAKEKAKAKAKEKDKGEKLSFGEYGNVRLTEREYDRLVEEYGFEKSEAAIKYLDEYIGDKGYKSQSHNLAIRRWVFNAIEERSAPPGNQGGWSQRQPKMNEKWRTAGGHNSAENDALKMAIIQQNLAGNL